MRGPSEKKFGKYTIVGRLGGGGMAEVFLAKLTGPAGFEKHLALKLIWPMKLDDPESVRLFIREAKLAAQLEHNNIVRIHEFDQIEGRHYIAMELVDGHDLQKVMLRARQIDRQLTIPEALMIASQVCRGLAYAHGELTQNAPEVIHRDIKPSNLILSKIGEVKISDFGLAKQASTETISRTDGLRGTLAYMSPEQARGEPIDKRSDIFSLGCVLWELLTGRGLFAGPNDAVTVTNLQMADIRPPSTYNPDLQGDLDEIACWALARDRDERIASAAQLGRLLEQQLAGYAEFNRAAGLIDLYRDLFIDPPQSDQSDRSDRGDDAAKSPRPGEERQTSVEASSSSGSGELSIQVEPLGSVGWTSAEALVRADTEPSDGGFEQPRKRRQWAARIAVLLGASVAFIAGVLLLPSLFLNSSDGDERISADPKPVERHPKIELFAVEASEAPSRRAPQNGSSGKQATRVAALGPVDPAHRPDGADAVQTGRGAMPLTSRERKLGLNKRSGPPGQTNRRSSESSRSSPRAVHRGGAKPDAGVTRDNRAQSARSTLSKKSKKKKTARGKRKKGKRRKAKKADRSKKVAAAKPKTQPKPKPKTETEAETEPKAETEAEHGWISITVVPWALVYIDGDELGLTPVKWHSLSVGKHSVTLVSSGVGRRISFEVHIQPGEHAQRVLNLNE